MVSAGDLYVEIDHYTLSRIEKKKSPSIFAFSSLSLPCTAFSPSEVANNFRIVPSAAWAGLVAPINVRKSATALAYSRMAAVIGPLLINDTNSP